MTVAVRGSFGGSTVNELINAAARQQYMQAPQTIGQLGRNVPFHQTPQGQAQAGDSALARELAALQGQNALQLAGTNNAAALQLAGVNNAAAQQLAGLNNQSAERMTQQRVAADNYAAQLRAQADQYAASSSADAQRYAAQLRAEADRYTSNNALQAALAPVQAGERRFNQVFPMVQQAFGQIASGNFGQQPGGSFSPTSFLNEVSGYFGGGPSLGPQQYQERLNQSNALAQQRAQTDIRQLGQQFGGRGLSGYNSPAMAELAGRSLAAAAADQSRNFLQSQFDFAQMQDDWRTRQNALLAQLLGGAMDTNARVYGSNLAYQSGLLNALTGLV